MAVTNEKLTPAMRQFSEFKAKYHDCILFFRMGDFYETLYEAPAGTRSEKDRHDAGLFFLALEQQGISRCLWRRKLRQSNRVLRRAYDLT